MTDVIRNFLRKSVGLSILMIAYFISSVLHLELWGNILSPLTAFAAGGILCFAYLKSDRSVGVSATQLLYAFACFAWGGADTLWAIMSFTGGAPQDSPAVWMMYVIPNVLILASLFLFAAELFKKWDLVQFGIDLVTTGFMTVVSFWILFLNKDIRILKTLLASDFTSILSIITDILICICIFSWFLSIRSGKIPSFLRIIAFGLVFFAFVDMYYYYVDYTGAYAPNTLVDFAYMASLCTIALGALWKTCSGSSVLKLSVVTNMGERRRWAYLLLFPFCCVIFSVAGLINTPLSMLDYITFAVPILLYRASCEYVQFSIEKEALLKRQNEMLEKRVAEQVSELTFLANQDTLTTLFNRRYFISCLDQTIQSICQSDLMALLLIDLDRFKTINDTYGHDVGDKVLIDLSYRMIEWNNYGATIARLGGDEFAILFAGKYTQKDIEDFCVEIIALCSKPIHIGDNTMSLTMSVGIALASDDAHDVKTLIKHADISMYSAKSQGYNKYQFYNPILSSDFRKTVEIEALLRKADIEKDFKLFFQPEYSLPDLKLTGAEALLRWENREQGFIPPNVFIPIAEEINYIFKIGKWVIQETIRQAIKWNGKYSMPLKVGFNVSPKQFSDDGFIKLLEALISVRDLNPEWIDAEITESVMINDGDHVDAVFSMLKKLGVSISIDDFGSGYSSLGCLNKYPFDRIKLDKSLIDNLSVHSTSGANVVRAAIDMAHASGIQTIAEGVETKEQLDILVKLKCDQVQGYLLGRPVPADVFEQLYIEKGSADVGISPNI